MTWILLLVVMAFFTWCCCSGGCIIFSDDFSADDIASYTQVSGSWSIGSGVLSTSSASAVLRCDTAASSSATGAYAKVTMTLATTSDKGRLLLAYLDSSNYWFAEVQPGATDGTLTLYERSGGTNTARGSAAITGLTATGSATVCLSMNGHFVVATAGGAGVGYNATPTVASRKAGLGTGSGSSSVTFDDFSFQKHYVDNPACPDCGTLQQEALPDCCDGYTSPTAVTLTITSSPDCCPYGPSRSTVLTGGNWAWSYTDPAPFTPDSAPVYCGVRTASIDCVSPGVFVLSLQDTLTLRLDGFELTIISCDPVHLIGTGEFRAHDGAGVYCSDDNQTYTLEFEVVE